MDYSYKSDPWLWDLEWKIASKHTIKGRRMKEIHKDNVDLQQLFDAGYPTWYQDLAEEEDKGGNKQQEDVYDAAGNKIDVKSQQKLSAKDAKKAIKDIEKKLKDGKKKKTLTDEEMWEMEDKLNELKEQLKGE